MAVVAVCGLLLVAGLVAGVRWSGEPFRAPPTEHEPTPREVARRVAWYGSLVLVAGPVVGACVIGAGGRLAMRLLAVTGGDGAQGRITEADEVVGDITAGGTISFILFNGILGGTAIAALYLLVRRLLPASRLAGVAFGAGLLVVAGTTVDPLRRDNPDFDLVGPGWLAVVVFTALALAYGFVLASFFARLSAWLPLPSPERRVLARYVWPAVAAVVLYPLTVVYAVAGLVVVLATRWPGLLDAVRSHRAVVAGRVLAVALLVVALPGALAAVADIVGR